MRIEEIETRLAAIATEMDAEGADLDALTEEVRTLKAEKETIKAEAEKRAKLRAEVAYGAGEVIRTFKEDTKMDERTFGIESVEYRNAYFKNLMGKDLDEAEQRSLTSGASSGGPAIPTIVKNEIIDALKKKYPILDRFGFTYLPSELSIPVYSTDAGAELRVESTNSTDANDAMTSITLGGYIIDKYITVTEKLDITSIPEFQDYLVTNLVANVGKLIANYVINGTGSSQPTGLAKAGAGTSGAYTTTDSVTVAATASIAEADVLKWLAMVDEATAEITMSYSTFLNNFYTFMNNAKNNLVREMNGNFYLIGHMITFEDSVPAGVAYLFAPDYFKGNFEKSITFERGRQIRAMTTEYQGYCLFDCKPVTGMGKFAKFTKTQA